MRPQAFMPALYVLAICWPVAAAGGEGAAAQGRLLQLAGGLILVIGIILLLSWLLRRLQGHRFGMHTPVRVIGGTAVGQRERAVLVQVGDQQLLLGVAPGSVRTLRVFEQPVVPDPFPSDDRDRQ